MAAYITVLYCVYVLSCVADDAACRLQRLSAIVIKRHYYYYYSLVYGLFLGCLECPRCRLLLLTSVVSVWQSVCHARSFHAAFVKSLWSLVSLYSLPPTNPSRDDGTCYIDRSVHVPCMSVVQLYYLYVPLVVYFDFCIGCHI